MPACPLPPTAQQIAALPPFSPLAAANIHLPVTAEDCRAAVDAIRQHAFVGFDTESKPTFVKGEAATGPHVVQFATASQAWLFQVRNPAARDALSALLGSTQTVKVGFGLKSDRSHIRARLGLPLRAVLDLTTWFRQQGYRNEIGVKTAVAIVLGQQFSKSKRMSTSNWSLPTLSAAQQLYAANDAYGAIAVFNALNANTAAPRPRWPIAGLEDAVAAQG